MEVLDGELRSANICTEGDKQLDWGEPRAFTGVSEGALVGGDICRGGGVGWGFGESHAGEGKELWRGNVEPMSPCLFLRQNSWNRACKSRSDFAASLSKVDCSSAVSSSTS